MILRIDPDIPHVWRTPDRLQFGIDRPLAVVAQVGPAEERLIAALLHGVTRQGLRLLAERAGASTREADRLIATLSPVLTGARSEHAPAPPRIAVCGTGSAADTAARLLAGLGFDLTPADRPDAAVVVDDYVIGPDLARHWLSRDVPHLCVVFGDTGVRIGPFVRPGSGPCVRCLHLAATEADPAWPALAVQLDGRSSPVHSGPFDTDVAITIAGVLRHPGCGPGGLRLDETHSIRLDAATGEAAGCEHLRRPECGCRSLPGTETESDAPPASRRNATSSAAASAVPA